MDSERLDHAARGLVEGSTRRRALFAFVTALATLMGALGLGDELDATAKKKKKKKKRKPPPPGCTGNENYCLDDSPCGPRGSGCQCAAGTEGTICAAPSGGLCFETENMCQADADCDAWTGPGSVCSVVTGSCTCAGVFATGFNGCIPPCAAA